MGNPDNNGFLGSNESRLGPPAKVVEGDVPDAHAQEIRPRPAGTYRTLIISDINGQFVVCLKEEKNGFVCFGSSWTNKDRYY
jgi:hypothetical protein